MDCIFCKIANGDIESKCLYEDDIVKVFLDINPDSNGHCLVVPKKHYQNLFDIDSDALSHIMKIAKYSGDMLIKKLSADGLTLIQNNGDIQIVKHFHLHLKPYYNKKQKIKDVDTIYQKLKK